MSLDVYLKGPEFTEKCQCNICGNEHTYTNRERYFDYNITHNVNKMAMECGLYEVLWRPEESGWFKAKDLIPYIESGLAELKSNPKKYKVFNPSNGWGSYEGLVKFATNYLLACKEYPEADVEVSR